jgi:hypothetical protein
MSLIEFVLLGVSKKNRQNNQKITLSCDKTNPTICPVLAALRLVLRARRLSQPDSMPVACYLKKGVMAYLTGSRIALHFRAAARAVRPNISKDDEQRYSAHLMRVWACVLLDEAEKLPDYIKKRLRWMEYSFQMYLRDTHVIQDQHREALRASSDEVMDLVSAPLPTYFVSASCRRRLLVKRKIWGYTRTTWIKGATQVTCSLVIQLSIFTTY